MDRLSGSRHIGERRELLGRVEFGDVCRVLEVEVLGLDLGACLHPRRVLTAAQLAAEEAEASGLQVSTPIPSR